MSSRYLAAVAAWVLGVAIATAGSIVAVNELAHGLLGQPAQQLVGTRASETHSNAVASSAPAVRATPAPTGRVATPAVSATAQAPAGTFLSSPDGSVVASCEPGGAYLQFWSPAQGFEVDDVARGPAPVASVTFEGSGGVVLRVSCTSGTPAAQVVPLPAASAGSTSPDR